MNIYRLLLLIVAPIALGLSVYNLVFLFKNDSSPFQLLLNGWSILLALLLIIYIRKRK